VLEEILNTIDGVLKVVVLIATVFFIFYWLYQGTIGVGLDIYRFLKKYKFPIKNDLRKILEQHHHFYKHLDTDNKAIFERRVWIFMHSKKFVPRKMKEVSFEMRVLISAAAIQLTFGLKVEYFDHFKRILVYPDRYYSEINQRYHQGEVNPKFGMIILSWKAFVEGYANPLSGRNLGLHEMAHAVKLEHQLHPLLGKKALRLWYQHAQHHLKNGNTTGFFRDYAFTNHHEFFAVAVENFFERPHAFKANKPELYQSLVYMLRQDPSTMIPAIAEATA
jgi:MtfA peptidase